MKRVLMFGLTGFAICALVAPPPVAGQEEEIGTGQRRVGRAVLSVLKVGQGARAAGMGGSYVAIADDINTIFVNPAGLTHIERAEYAFSYTRWLVDSGFYSGAVAYNIERGVLGLSVFAHSPPKMMETTIFQPLGTGRELDAGDVSIGLTFARKLTDRLSFGVQVRWTQETLDVDRISAVDVNLGTMFYTGYRSLRLGMTFLNLGKDQKILETEYHLPVAFNLATAMEVIGNKGDQTYITATFENYFATDFAEPQYRLGGELWLQNTVALRGGYQINSDLETFSMGAGVKFQPVEGREIRADFSYSDYGRFFDAPLRFSLSGSF